MCFNVFSHNRDDHSKNFSFLYLEDERRWILPPAYDLTYSSSQGGEHATTIDGEGRSPGLDDILSVAKKSGIDARYARARAKEIEEITKEMLKEYL
jgi:serine/threonine-protein kinase HipA